MKKKIGTKLFVFEVIPSEFVALNCLYQERIHETALSMLGKGFEMLHIPMRDFL